MISVLIPTLNRSDFLIRALHYYSAVGFNGYICIGDSSDARHVGNTKRAIQALRGKLRIIYRTFPIPPSMSIDPLGTPGGAMCVKELIELAPTPYAVCSGDDDFVIPGGLEQCAAFLDVHPEYSAAHGIRISIRLQSEGAFGQLTSAWYRPQPILESETASERWAGYMRSTYSTQYSVHRTETWRRVYRDVASVPMRYLGSEMLVCGITAILGKVKQLDCLSTVFQVHDNRVFGWDTHSMYDLIIHPKWSRSVLEFRDSVAGALVEQDGIDMKEAQEIVDRELWHHILAFLSSHYNKRHGELTSRNSSKEIFKGIPGLTQPISLAALLGRLRRMIRKRRSGPTNEYEDLVSLDSLLKPSSPFHADFMPVYHTITTPPSES